MIADTHLPRGKRRVPERCVAVTRAVDAVIHAGDFVTEDALAQIEEELLVIRARHAH